MVLLGKLEYRKKIFIYLSSIFIVFTILVLLFQYKREKDFKRDQIEISLNNIAELTYNYIERKGLDKEKDLSSLDSLYLYIPDDNIRVTVLDKLGKVLYDSEVKQVIKMENHLHRPEIQKAIKNGQGSNIRESTTTGFEYYYYAKNYSDLFIRTAAHYNLEVKNFLVVEKLFLFYLITLFLVTWLFISLITKNLSSALFKLKDFATRLSHGEEVTEKVDFPKGEFGEISKQIADIYDKLTLAKSKIEIEKNKLFSHLHALNEGIAFFTPDKKKILRNNHFIQYLNIISDETNISEEQIFIVKEFENINKFLEKHLGNEGVMKQHELPHMEEIVYKDKRAFNIHAIIFADRSFEIVIRDITQFERQKKIKEEITSNIAHELKTPIMIILGYLELLKENSIDKNVQTKYIANAYTQSERLSDLIQDISILHKMSEARDRFKFELLSLNELIYEVKDSLNLSLEDKGIKVNIRLAKPVFVKANKSLLISVFYNLFDNAIKYGGEGIEISLNNYLEDTNFYYFSFSNTGNSIDKNHFLRIFERFYRVDEDRSRPKGGTGLGLSIVKNAIQLHGGEITVGNLKEGGVEFLFTVSKS
ncbi:ATP-binding protein [Lutimonas halocynthiae]|uniref:sensor histidine kinase n=1 Tax=Lutimonas halocynthiae TaxID=1446477 RepID=UPI0025B53C0B|nr:ATP-binding protein [Lutimonas halocynthiae]MDN3641736.1 ATP-binding protein [Lutimonas halocynthiae]